MLAKINTMSDRPNNFTEYILKTIPSNERPLPLTYTTDGYGFREFLEDQKLKPGPCNVFNEELLYLFYGRPAYRVGSEVEPTKFNFFFPVCILLNPECIKVVKRLYPFDSGAFATNLYSEYMHKNFNLDNFLVNPNPNAPGQIPFPETPAHIISSFFDNNRNYYDDNIRESVGFGSLDFEAQSYYELIKSKRQSIFDDRRSAIEIQTDEIIPLSSDTVCAVVLPQAFMDDEKIKATIVGNWNAKLLTYPSYRSEPAFFIPFIMDNVRNFLQDEGLI